MIAMSDRGDIDATRQDEGAFLAALEALGSTIKGKSVSCPQHDDRTPSASILPGTDGVWRVYCHVCSKGWDVFDLREMAGGRSVADQLREARQASKPPLRIAEKKKVIWPDLDSLAAAELWGVQARYDYTHPDTGAIELAIYRCMGSDGKKTFRQASPRDGGWISEAPPKPWPIFNRKRLRDAETVVVVEGEKCVLALHGIGIVATTSPCGAGKSAEADWSPLAGKRVYLWPDNDPPDPKKKGARTGIDHMRQVMVQLEAIHPAPSIHWIDPDGLGLPDKGDVADLLDAMDAAPPETCAQTVNGILADAEPMGASRSVDALIEDTISGKRRAIPWPWPRLSELSKALLPGTVTLLCGDAGSTKSFLLLEAMAYWHEQGERVAIFELEEDRPYHLYRALAQRVGEGRLFDDEWVMKNPGFARQAASDHRAFLNSFGRCIWEAPNDQLTLKQLAEWMKQRAESGVRIIAIDPVTAVKSADKPWAEDLTFIMAAKTIAREHACSVILVTHPRTGAKNGSLSEIAGGSAYPRFSQAVFWLEAFAQPKSMPVQSKLGVTTQTFNRCIAIRKARNGKGSGLKVAFQFLGESLRFAEVGIVLPPAAKSEPSRPGDRFERMRDGSPQAEGML